MFQAKILESLLLQYIFDMIQIVQWICAPH